MKGYKDLLWAYNDAVSRFELEAGHLRLGARPRFLILDPSSRCNARCVMCPVSFRPPSDRGEDLPRAVFDKVKWAMPMASHINLFSTGEPLLAREIVTFMDETRRLAGERAQIWLSTNGKRVPVEILERLRDHRIGLQFSVDGGTKAVFEAIRRGVRFEQLIGSLEAVARIRAETGHPRLSFSCTMSKRNLCDLSAIFALAAKFGVEQVLFYDEDPEVPEEDAFILDERDRSAFEAQRTFIESTGIRHYNGLGFRGALPRGSEPAAPSPTRGRLECCAPWRVFHVHADGSVRTCCTLRDSMGNLNEQSLEEIWNGERYMRLRRAFLEQIGLPPACLTCTDPLRNWGG